MDVPLHFQATACVSLPIHKSYCGENSTVQRDIMFRSLERTVGPTPETSYRMEVGLASLWVSDILVLLVGLGLLWGFFERGCLFNNNAKPWLRVLNSAQSTVDRTNGILCKGAGDSGGLQLLKYRGITFLETYFCRSNEMELQVRVLFSHHYNQQLDSS